MPTKRKSDVNHKWNNKKYLINHLIELVVVVIGISIAFALNRWYENTKSEELEQKYMESLFDDLEKDKDIVDWDENCPPGFAGFGKDFPHGCYHQDYDGNVNKD